MKTKEELIFKNESGLFYRIECQECGRIRRRLHRFTTLVPWTTTENCDWCKKKTVYHLISLYEGEALKELKNSFK